MSAAETLYRGTLSFEPEGTGNSFYGIWPKAAQWSYEMVESSITALAEPTRDAGGRQVVRLGMGHISFSQSLLVSASSAIERYGDLTSEDRGGAPRNTSGRSAVAQTDRHHRRSGPRPARNLSLAVERGACDRQ